MHVKSITLKIYERILTEAKKNGNAEKLKPTTSKKKKLNKPKEKDMTNLLMSKKF